ncbi:hypothetical protein GJ699_02560 [Duganella sp. FT80W]|uniref:HeH/LEM domain-containing protein n=1 Tax=Duganella guangzhouensis TaxID=2666084 RepID=A0A6I2KU30_9BURK|nr:HeH/LEM domain-containing protein [Duganella guangzhouensis]MRW88860.1 hypothetical protein [Duganella guangzhouensis]
MQIDTIKIKAPISADNSLGYVVINKSDFDPSQHELLDGETLGDDTNTTNSDVPTLAELIVAQSQLASRKDELDDRELQLNQRASALDEREQALVDREAANAAEAQRLADLAAASTTGADISSMTKAQLQAALTAKGVSYSSTADKAELVALLTAAQ